MNITGVKIDWMEAYSNKPSITVLVDERMPHMDELKWMRNDGLYYTVLSCGIIDKMYHDPRNEHGYSGREFRLPMLDGSYKTIKGPWSSRAQAINQLTKLNTVDITVEVESTGNRVGNMCILKDVLQHVLDVHMPGITIEMTDLYEFSIPKSQKESYDLVTNA